MRLEVLTSRLMNINDNSKKSSGNEYNNTKTIKYGNLFLKKMPSNCDDEDDDDDEVRRVCKTPGDPCRCTRQHSQRSGLPLPSRWI